MWLRFFSTDSSKRGPSWTCGRVGAVVSSDPACSIIPLLARKTVLLFDASRGLLPRRGTERGWQSYVCSFKGGTSYAIVTVHNTTLNIIDVLENLTETVPPPQWCWRRQSCRLWFLLWFRSRKETHLEPTRPLCHIQAQPSREMICVRLPCNVDIETYKTSDMQPPAVN